MRWRSHTLVCVCVCVCVSRVCLYMCVCLCTSHTFSHFIFTLVSLSLSLSYIKVVCTFVQVCMVTCLCEAQFIAIVSVNSKVISAHRFGFRGRNASKLDCPFWFLVVSRRGSNRFEAEKNRSRFSIHLVERTPQTLGHLSFYLSFDHFSCNGVSRRIPLYDRLLFFSISRFSPKFFAT